MSRNKVDEIWSQELGVEKREGSGVDCIDGEVWGIGEVDGCRESGSVIGLQVLRQVEVL